MAKVWEEIGENKWKLTISPDQGGPASVYYGTKDEITDKLADSQANANRRIAELRPVNGNGHHAPPVTEPAPMTPGDRMQVVSDLSNPATVDKGVTRVLESVIGPVDRFRQDREAERAERTERAAISAVEEFCELTPTYLPSDFNNNTLVNYMRNMGYDPTAVASYQRAYAELSGAQLLQPAPSQAPPPDEPPTEPQERNAPTLSAPRATTRYSTGVRSSDISGTAPVPTTRLKYTREQIANMSASTYKASMSDPEFVRAVEFYSKPQRRAPARAV